MNMFTKGVASLAALTLGLAIYSHDFIPLASVVAPLGITYLLEIPKGKKDSK